MAIVDQAPQGQQQVPLYQEGQQVSIPDSVDAASDGSTAVLTEKNDPDGSITVTEERVSPDGIKSLVITTKPATSI